MTALQKEKRRSDQRRLKFEAARSALKVIHTWAVFRPDVSLVPRHVEELCLRTLKETEDRE